MLSRVAESLLWMARYLERADSLARMVEAIDETLLDQRHPALSNNEAYWAPVYQILDLEVPECIEETDDQNILHHLLLDRRNITSVGTCISGARFNARAVRDQLINEVWEVINDLHHYCESLQASERRINVAEFGAKVRYTVHCFRGIVSTSIPRGEVWSFLMLGMQLERADQISRILNLKTFILDADRSHRELLEPYAWLIVTKATVNNFTGHGSSLMDWEKLERDLIFDLTSPYSIRSCVIRLNAVLDELLGADKPTLANEAEFAGGKLKSELDMQALRGIPSEEFHDYLDNIQCSLSDLFGHIIELFIQESSAQHQEQGDTTQ